MLRSVALSILCILTLAACAPKTIVRPVTKFDPVATQKALGKGQSSVSGQAFTKTRGGEVRYAAGNTIALFPFTPYFQEVWKLQNSREPSTILEANPALKNYKRETVADGAGRFKFTGVLPGKYYVSTSIIWEVPVTQYVPNYGAFTSMKETGGEVSGIVTITRDGEAVEVILQ